MKTWIEEVWLLAAVLLGALILSLALGQKYWIIPVAMLVYSLWMIFRLKQLHHWLDRGAETKQAPDTTGIMDSVVQLIHRQQRAERLETKVLRRTIAEFNHLASELPDATVLLDNRWQIQWCNATAESLLGITRKRDEGQRIDNLLRTPEFIEFLHTTDSGHNDLEITSPVTSLVTLLLTCVPAGQQQYLLSARNITQQVQLREMRKAFVADVSHELRTPLTVVQGHLEMLRENPDIDESDQLALLRISEQSARMQGIVEDLLTLSKLESRYLTDAEGRWIDFATLIKGLVASTSVKALDKKHQLVMHVDDSLSVLGMERELYSCAQNLLQNAIAYTPEGTLIEIEWRLAGSSESIPRWETVIATKESDKQLPGNEQLADANAVERNTDKFGGGGYSTPINAWPPLHTGAMANTNTQGTAWLIVRDYGDGIEAEHLPKLSQRFYRADQARSRSTGGTGLGLAIVKHIAQRHGGNLQIASKFGQGSMFSISFPSERVSKKSADSIENPQQAAIDSTPENTPDGQARIMGVSQAANDPNAGTTGNVRPPQNR